MKARNLYALAPAFALWLMGSPAPASAATAVGPICDTAATVVDCSGTLGITNGTCGSWSVRGMLVGTYYYQYTGGCASTCGGSTCNGGAGNYVVVSGSSGYDFRQLHLITNASSYSKSCDRCALGLLGATGSVSSSRVRADNRQYGTRLSSWFTVTCGDSGYCSNTVGFPRL